MTPVGETIVRLRAGASTDEDRYGDPLPSDDVRTPITGAMFDPGGTREPAEVGRQPVITTPKLYFRDQEPNLSAGDRVEVRGLVFDIEGDLAVWVNPWTGRTEGTVVELKRVNG
ncbi:MAG: hypothetical protein ABW143_09025 [Acidimicrobiales bacterium]